MGDYLVIHSKRWDYRPSTDALAACVQYLQDQGIIGSVVSEKNGEYSIGHRCEPELGVGGEWVSIRATPHLQIACGPLEAACNQCGAEVPAWPELFHRFYDSDQEPVYMCPQCGVQTPLTQLDYLPGAAFGYVMITFAEPGALEPTTSTPTWAEMERILHTELTHTCYTL